ncbi:BMP family ABC transporter substrate-binding protein, partial [Mycoplasmopsis synoviae]
MKKKFILPIIITPIAATAIIATACGDQSEAQKPSGWIPKEERVAQIKTVDLTSVKEEARSQKYVLITDKGDVHDKSFNQSSWEALNQLYDQTGAEVNFIQPSTENYTQAYNQALSQGYTVWILSG